MKDGKFSPYLFSMKTGDSVEMKGPLGYFVPRDPLSDSIFVATGTGIAPFRAMLLDPSLLKSPHQFHLLFGARYEEGLLYREEFEELERRHPNFRFIPTLTRPPEGWKGHVGRVQPVLIDLIGDRRDIDVYVCGLKAMVDEVRGILKELGFDRKRIIYEKYD